MITYKTLVKQEEIVRLNKSFPKKEEISGKKRKTLIAQIAGDEGFYARCNGKE